MLDPNWINNNLDDITVLTADLQTAALTSIAKHVADSLRVQPDIGIMPSTAKQIQSAEAAGLLYEDIEQYVAAYLKLAVPEIRKLFTAAAVESIAYDNAIYKAAGVEPIGLSPAMQRIIQTRADTFTATLKRLTGVFTATAAEKMSDMLNEIYKVESRAFLQTVSGVESYVSAMHSAVDELVKDGVKVYDYASGRSISVESAVLRDLRTSISQVAAAVTEEGMKERNCEFCEVSAHQGARNRDVAGRPWANHENFQGKVYKVNSWT